MGDMVMVVAPDTMAILMTTDMETAAAAGIMGIMIQGVISGELISIQPEASRAFSVCCLIDPGQDK